MSRAIQNFLMWIPIGAVLACMIARRYITRHMARRLDAAIAARLSPAEWQVTKHRLSNYQVALYAIVTAGGAVVGAGIGALGLLE